MDPQFISNMINSKGVTFLEFRDCNKRYMHSVLQIYRGVACSPRNATTECRRRAYEEFLKLAPDTVISLDDVVQYYEIHCNQHSRNALIVLGSIGNPCQLDPLPSMHLFAFDATPLSLRMITAVGGFVGNFAELHDNMHWIWGSYKIWILSSVNRNGYVG